MIVAARDRDLAAFSGVVEVVESLVGVEIVLGHPDPRQRGRGISDRPAFGHLSAGSELTPGHRRVVCSTAGVLAIDKGIEFACLGC
jgi:hypothetical protein